MAKKTKVRVTIEPGVVRSVDDAELIDLDRQGLIHSSEAGHGRHEWKPEEEADVVEASAPVTKTKTEKGA